MDPLSGLRGECSLSCLRAQVRRAETRARKKRSRRGYSQRTRASFCSNRHSSYEEIPMSAHQNRTSLADLPWKTVKGHGQFLPMQSNWRFDLVPSGFTPTYTVNARDTRVEEFARQEHPLLFNGPTLCLEGINPKTRTVSISKGDFYDFLYSNILSPVPFGSDRAPSAILASSVLPNALAVSLQLTGPNGEFLITSRSDKLAVGPGIMSTTVTGGIDPHDLQGDNPFLCCAAREFKEEIGVSLPSDSLQFRGIAIGARKLQAVGIVDAICGDERWATIVSHATRSDEIQSFSVIGKDAVAALLRQKRFTEAASMHLFLITQRLINC